ncbi:SDR family NAD(P)-dependent oxidoreductase [Nonomuraea terrae]|uniref:SDR family NAD(P)-dependent oxidoreductase n=1 Tax=Nonomuraea terrae TaxID=2530383 RepID=UPI001CB71FC3|nr:SDR family NAD(P)-dependent oxidoreductase [Nonomuraea terrae]
MVGVASIAAQVGLPYYVAYGAVKAGVARFDDAMRRELSGSGVHVVTVYPGPVDTPMMASARPAPGLGRRPLDEVVAEIVAGIEALEAAIVPQLPEGRAMSDLEARDPLAVDASIAPTLGELPAAVSSHRRM